MYARVQVCSYAGMCDAGMQGYADVKVCPRQACAVRHAGMPCVCTESGMQLCGYAGMHVCTHQECGYACNMPDMQMPNNDS